MNRLDLDGPLWRFALEFYALPGVAEACLTLQDEAQIDVIQLLTAIYADLILRQPLSSKDLPELDRQTAEWRGATVLPLRDIRRFLKPERDGFPEERHLLREKVKAAELLAEQIQLAMTERWLSRREPGPGLPAREVFALLMQEDVSGQPRNERVIDVAISTLEIAMAPLHRKAPAAHRMPGTSV
ncbi:TIGR02444 family protein [uncultured Bosea sp.]|uniref:TIGR02444 family protein n=1 Tax=uncultured Bosea sp. TaxID=211457 RepID=UPI0025F93D93|nr:TIGR02444 family protein [uncultured Bosea sp.]